ncbi:MAG: MMPL family transporter, partial [Candidatus Obscuribacterales bacterium]|nr:MMPL family transporter [Steroidobacteraceae bacterium]
LIAQYSTAVIRYRWPVLLVTSLLTAFLVSRIGVLKLNNDPDIWAPQSHEFTKTTRELEEVFGGRNITVIGIVAKQGDIYDARILQKVSNIQTAIEALPEAIKQNTVSLAARRVKDIEGTAEGMTVREMLRPLPRTADELKTLKEAVARNPIYIDALVSPDGKAAAVIADFHIEGQDAAYAPLYKKLRAIADAEQDDSADILIGGQPVHAAHLEFAMEKMPLYFGIAFLIILAVQFFAFRSVQGMLLPLLTGILAVLWGLGIMSMIGLHMDALNTTTPILIMAAATGHAVQILKRYYEELARITASGTVTDLRRANHAALSAALVQVAPVMLTAGSIAAIAFFSLLVSDVPMIRNFGLLAGCGIVAAIIVELTLIPALRAVLPVRALPKAVRHDRHDLIDAVLARVGGWLTAPATARVIILVAVVFIVAVSSGAARVVADNSFKQYFLPDSAVRQADARLNQAFGGTDSVAFLVRGQGQDSIKDARVLQAMAKLQSFLETQPYVGKTQSVADLVKRMNQSMHGEDPAYNNIPSDSKLVSQYLLLYSLSGDPQDFDNLVDNDYQRAVVWAYLKTDSTTYVKELYAKCQQLIAKEFPPGVTVSIGGSVPQTMASNEALVATKAANILQMAIVVFVLASLAFRSFVGGLLVVIPLAAIVFMNLGLMGWFGVPLDMGTASITAMVMGIGADYEIYMLFRLREEYNRYGDLNRALQASLLTSGKAVLFVALSIAGGYSALLISDFRFYPRLGSTMMMTMAISAVLSLLLLRALVAMLRPRFIVGAPASQPVTIAQPS